MNAFQIATMGHKFIKPSQFGDALGIRILKVKSGDRVFYKNFPIPNPRLSIILW